jgi:hypothetical protein
MSLQILDFDVVTGHKSVIAEFKLYNPVKESKMLLTVIRTKKGGFFVPFPSKCKKLDDGTFKYIPLYELSEKKSKEFQKEVLELLQPFLPLG